MVPPVITTDAVERYLQGLRPAPDAILAEVHARGMREGVPIVSPETGQLLHILALAGGARRIIEVGTAIGFSTLYLARALPADGVIVSFEIDERRHEAAAEYLRRAGVADRTDLRLQDAREGLASLQGTFDMAFVDGVKTQYGDYLDLLLPLLGERAMLVVDNVLMSGTVADGRSDGTWSEQHIAAARAFNERVLSLEEFEATVTGALKQGGSAAERITRVLDGAFGLVLDHLDVMRVVEGIYYGPPQGAPHFDFDVIHQRFMDTLVGLVREGMETGEFRRADPLDMAWVLVGPFEVAREMSLCHPEAEFGRNRLGRLLNVVFQGVLAEGAKELSR